MHSHYMAELAESVIQYANKLNWLSLAHPREARSYISLHCLITATNVEHRRGRTDEAQQGMSWYTGALSQLEYLHVSCLATPDIDITGGDWRRASSVVSITITTNNHVTVKHVSLRKQARYQASRIQPVIQTQEPRC
jgi:hypothetical protein